MKSVQVYDLPIRIFHALFATCFIISFSIGKIADDESLIYAVHMLSGFMMTFLVFLRIAWGIVGSEYSTFHSMPLSLGKFIHYFRNITDRGFNTFVGHNPASSWLFFATGTLSLLMTITGIMMTLKFKKYIVEDIHEVLAHIFLLLVLLHITGLILHAVKFKDQLYLSMVTGKKRLAEHIEFKNIKNHFLVAYLFIFLTLTFAGYLYKNFDQGKGTLTILNYTLPLLEVEDAEAHGLENDD